MTPGMRSAVFAILGLIAGLLLGYFGRQFLTVELKKDIGLGDVLNFTITLIFAFLLQNYLQKRFGNERAEKDHIIDLIKESLVALRETRASFTAIVDRKRIDPADEKSLLAYLRNLSNSLSILQESVHACGDTNGEAACIAIRQLYIGYKRILTGGNFPSKPYSMKTFNDAEKASGQISLELNKMRIQLNRK